MGTDVHAIVQAREPGGEWRDVPCGWLQQRNYFLFGWLAGVRNGYGFAGVNIYRPHNQPIAYGRGFPEDFTIVDGDLHPAPYEAVVGFYSRDWKIKDGELIELDEPQCSISREDWERPYEEGADKYGYDGKFWMGAHDYTWASAEEILEAHVPLAQHYGYVEREEYITWKREGTPDPRMWAGGVSNPERSVTETACINGLPPADALYVYCTWESEDLGVADFRKHIQNVVDNHPGQEVRIVMGFDS